MQKSHFFELPEHLRAAVPGADRFQYQLTVESEDRRHTIEASEAAISPELRTLLDFLTSSARRPK